MKPGPPAEQMYILQVKHRTGFENCPNYNNVENYHSAGSSPEEVKREYNKKRNKLTCQFCHSALSNIINAFPEV